MVRTSTDCHPLVAVTMGDPAGVGAEVVVKGLPAARRTADVLVVGDAGALRDAVRLCDADLTVRDVGGGSDAEAAAAARDAGAGVLPVLDLDNVASLEYGELSADCGRASLEYVERAIALARDGVVDAMTTAPINKRATRLAGSEYAGHTDMLADYTDTDEYAMLLVESDLRVSHVSTHVPLREACDLVTADRVSATIRVTADALGDLGVADPTLAVAGLNPHASDGGRFGSAEAEEIEPAVERARADGIDVRGPEPPDTVYVRALRGAYDCVVSMYHDQGHIPVKLLGFSREGEVSGVNVTAGLPIVRTSVDHGTAFDIAGEGVASERSLVDAVDVAARMARSRAER